MLRLKKAVTLIEILIAVLIAGIIAALTIPNLSSMKERALDREAEANLKLIQAAEKIYKIEYLVYKSATSTQDVNSQLKLALPSGEARNWSYSIISPDGSGFEATVTRKDAPSGWERRFKIDEDGEVCCASGNCPPDMPGC